MKYFFKKITKRKKKRKRKHQTVATKDQVFTKQQRVGESLNQLQYNFQKIGVKTKSPTEHFHDQLSLFSQSGNESFNSEQKNKLRKIY